MSLTIVCLSWLCLAQADGASALEERTWSVAGLDRTGLVHVPRSAKTQPTPVVFAFHGHGGSAQGAARMFRFHESWPEAMVVYLQGVPTPGRLTDPEGKRNGWQHSAGDHDDRDLKLFDTVLAALRAEYKIDDRRLYSTGHSNGGGFTYLLWVHRGDVLAAVAPSAAAARALPTAKPKPAMIIGSENDPLVLWKWQQACIDFVLKLNQCDSTGEPWGDGCTLYASKTGTPLVTFIHENGHKFAADALPNIVKFFKEQALPESAASATTRSER
ncbi:MAG TPA: hypothetical protein VG713_04390 [Pirellulales bacterium]|nr:hypothetical protein [Pirellulales bacterium]